MSRCLGSNAESYRFFTLVDEYNPDVTCGSESHLDRSFYASEIFPDTYNVFRKNMYHGWWRSLLCIKKYLRVLEKPQLDVEVELIWVKLTLLNQSPIHICDLLCENRPFRHIWYFEKYHFETS